MARRLVLAVASSALVAIAVLACSSDALNIIELDAGDRSLPDGTADQASPAANDSGLLPDGADAGEADANDGGEDGSGPPPGCISCDCDRDGYNRASCGDGQGKDCNDNDPRVHPGAEFDEGSVSDIDCSGAVEKKFPANVSCAGLVCPSAAGFTGNPACGEIATYVTCKSVLVVGCQVDTTTQRKQTCK